MRMVEIKGVDATEHGSRLRGALGAKDSSDPVGQI